MSDREPAATAAPATHDAADLQPLPTGPRPFARPTPTGAAGPTAGSRRSPFVAPAAGPVRAPRGVAPESTAVNGAPSDAPPAAAAAMRWPCVAELDAANVLDAIARRLRAGTLRLPIAVDPRSPTGVLAAVLAAVHADSVAAPPSPGGAERPR